MEFKIGIAPWTIYAVANEAEYDMNAFGEPCADAEELAALIEQCYEEKCFPRSVADRLTEEALTARSQS